MHCLVESGSIKTGRAELSVGGSRADDQTSRVFTLFVVSFVQNTLWGFVTLLTLGITATLNRKRGVKYRVATWPTHTPETMDKWWPDAVQRRANI